MFLMVTILIGGRVTLTAKQEQNSTAREMSSFQRVFQIKPNLEGKSKVKRK